MFCVIYRAEFYIFIGNAVLRTIFLYILLVVEKTKMNE